MARRIAVEICLCVIFLSWVARSSAQIDRSLSGQSTNNGTPKYPAANYDIFNAQAGTLADSIINNLLVRKVSSVSFRKTTIGLREIEDFVWQRIAERLLENKVQIETDSAANISLKVAVPFAGVNYSAPILSHIFSSSEVVRTIRSSYDVEVADSGQLRFAKSYSFTFADTVEQSQIPELEAGSYGFLRGRSDPAGFLDSILQPVIFAASAAIIVYLFFTLRGS